MTITTITPAEFERLRREDPSLELIDVRTPLEYRQVHAAGARLVPLDQLDPKQLLASRRGHEDRAMYFICKSGSRATKAVEAMHASGFTGAVCIEGGTDAWDRAGLPVERSASKAISLERQVRIAAGLLVLIGLILGWFVHPYLYGISAFVGAGLVFAGITDWCGMGLLIAKMPWNR